jgi:hypothetical protein
VSRVLILAVVAYFGLAALALGAVAAFWQLSAVAPEQPIAFSHALHAGRSEIACSHCHVAAANGPRATVPAMSVCAECHAAMTTQNPEILALQEHLKNGTPILWTQVHQLPWHVHFTHKRHVRAGVACETCHGEVETMERLRRARSLEMGWCVGCHRLEGASTDCLTCHK